MCVSLNNSDRKWLLVKTKWRRQHTDEATPLLVQQFQQLQHVVSSELTLSQSDFSCRHIKVLFT
jgi:hypothetical protein